MLTTNYVMIEMKNREVVWDVKFAGVTFQEASLAFGEASHLRWPVRLRLASTATRAEEPLE
ncbi:hypothetical protein LH53_10775 [Mesotoga sp. TolDC]|nr:hypothetical protein LH53_10775 [Mesotoga sp. TolDC]